MVKLEISNLQSRVRFSYPAPLFLTLKGASMKANDNVKDLNAAQILARSLKSHRCIIVSYDKMDMPKRTVKIVRKTSRKTDVGTVMLLTLKNGQKVRATFEMV